MTQGDELDPVRVGQDGHRQDRVVVESRQRTGEPVRVGKAVSVRHRGAAVVQIGGVGVVVVGVARLRRRIGVAQRQRLRPAPIRLVTVPGPGGRGFPIVCPGAFGLGAVLPMKPKFSPEK